MKKLIAAITLIALILCSAVSALASNMTYKTISKANVRSGPGLEYSVITSFPKGKHLDSAWKYEEDYRGVTWYLVYLDNYRTGWISEACVDEGTYNTEYSAYGTYLKTQGRINLRSQPNLNGKILTEIPKGAKLAFDGDFNEDFVTDSRGVDWYEVTYNGITGWVSDKYISLVRQ